MVQVAAPGNPYAELVDGQRSLIAKGLAKFEADDHDFNVMMPAAGLYVQVQDTLPKCPAFYKDVAKAWRKYGRLTDRQVVAIMNGMRRCSLLNQAFIDYPDPEFVVTYPTIPAKPKLQEVPVGFYTLGDEEGHITIRVKHWTPAGETEPKVMVAVLVGPHNVSDYMGFGEVKNNEVVVWSRFRDGYARWYRAACALFTGDYQKFGMDFALTSNCCRRCGAVLTVPTSVHQGYGPECIKHVGG